jgi:glycosyltransferase involved in cell wall biosynthesis
MRSRVLFLTHEPPLPLVSGARLRSFHLMRELAGRGHAISLFALSSGQPPSPAALRQLHDLCERVELYPFAPSPLTRRLTLAADYVLRRPFERRYFYSADAAAAAAQLMHELAPDAVIVGQLYMEPYLPARLAAMAVFDSHNVEARRIASMIRAGGLRGVMARSQVRPIASHEAAVVARLGRTWAVSSVERDYFARIAPGRVDLVANGVDCGAIRPRRLPAGQPEVVFLGRMDYGPNVDGACYLIEEILPRMVRKDATIRIVGANPPTRLLRLAARTHAPIEVTGFVAETGPYLESARVLVVSLRSGGGTRLKILEALARGLPVVSTTLGCEGLDLRHGHDAMINDDPGEFAHYVDLLLDDDQLCASLARNGRETVEHRFDWPVIGAGADLSLRGMLLGHPPNSVPPS